MDYDEELYSFDDDKPKRKRHEDPTTWADAFKAIGIFMGLVVVYSIIGNIIYQMFLVDKLNAYLEIATSTTASNPFFNANTFQSPAFMIASIIFSIVGLVIGLLLTYGIIHIFATQVFKGDGKLAGLIVRANIWTMGTYFAVSIASYIQNLIMINMIVEKFEGINIGTSYAAMQSYNEAILSIMLPMYLVYGIAWLVWSIAVSRIVGRNYAIGDGKGCGALIGMNVSFFVLFCACSFALGMGMYGLASSI